MKRILRQRIPERLAAAFIVSLVISPFAPISASAQTLEDLQRQIDAMQVQLDVMRARQEATQAEQADAAKTDDASKKQAEQQQVQIKWGPAPTFTSPDGKFQMKPRGRLLVDAGWVGDENNGNNISATEFRAARLGIEGIAWGSVAYKFEVDFAGNNVAVKDAYMSWKGPVEIKIGQFKLATSLEEATSGRFTTFMERASFTDAFGFGRQIGIGVSKSGDHWSAQAAISRGSISSTAPNEGIALAGRVTYGPEFGDIQAHFGGSLRYRRAGKGQSDFRYSQRPHNHLAASFLDTTDIARSDTYWGLEAAAVRGPLSLQLEYGWLVADLNDPAAGSATFSGGYASLSWFITGESRAYKAGKGTFDRVNVRRPVSEGGIGAWQIAARFDRIDLSDQGILGGEQDSFILGVNWHLNDHARLMANFSHSTIDNAIFSGLNGLDGENDVDAIGFRAQVDW